MSVKLNEKALQHARSLVKRDRVVRDRRDDWSEHAPSADDGSEYIDAHGIEEYALWFLGEDTDENEGTKARHLFPYGDFSDVHRCAVISGESRAGQYHHRSVEDALKDLLGLIDEHEDDEA
ncbi:MAG: hypothetical protein J7484_07955 [Microbacterium sp.]|nr:hypothetical protein [Microbacterium sp.]